MSASTSVSSVTTFVSYFPKAGGETALLALVREHWPILNQLGLATPRPAKIWRASDKRSGKTFIAEMFDWRDASSSEIAHQTPEVMAVWERMGPLLEDMSILRLHPVETAHGD